MIIVLIFTITHLSTELRVSRVCLLLLRARPSLLPYALQNLCSLCLPLFTTSKSLLLLQRLMCSRSKCSRCRPPSLLRYSGGGVPTVSDDLLLPRAPLEGGKGVAECPPLNGPFESSPMVSLYGGGASGRLLIWSLVPPWCFIASS